MQFPKSKPIVISVGGSLIIPNGGPNVAFLKALELLIRKEVKNGHRFVLVCGGGKTARHYIDAGAQIHSLDPEDLDWIGIHATRLNAHLFRTILRDIAHPNVIKSPLSLPKKWKGKVLVAAGWKPGWSTDYVAARIAKRLGSKQVINLSNISYVYEEDPRKNPKAKPLETLSWRDYRQMVGDDWSPGKSAPFDPVASRFCAKYHMSAAIMNGENLDRLAKLLKTGVLEGTYLA